jgi:hypothetical protein
MLPIHNDGYAHNIDSHIVYVTFLRISQIEEAVEVHVSTRGNAFAFSHCELYPDYC